MPGLRHRAYFQDNAGPCHFPGSRISLVDNLFTVTLGGFYRGRIAAVIGQSAFHPGTGFYTLSE